jgi:CRP/FNR family transcriptional regulator, cyclic AMP receptor protein
VGFLAELPAEDRRLLLASARFRRFGPREIVFHEGDPADAFMLIEKGRLAVRVATPRGDTVTLTVLGPGDIVGELALLGGGAIRSATVAALEPTEVWSFHRDMLHALRRERASIDAFVLRTLVEDIHRLSGLLLEALYIPVDTRVLRRLHELERRYRTTRAPTIIPLTQDDLASIAGTSRATTNRVLRQAEADGFLRLRRGRVEVLDPAVLEGKVM